jgi:3D-(3,5/4)-trihydroxycyclohexane-1,2-dione acylhydrolase (decyclizing)
VDLAANAAAFGAHVLRARTVTDLRAALASATQSDRTTVIHVKVDRYAGVDAGGAWWDVATAEVAEPAAVRGAGERRAHEKRKQRWHIG